MLGYSVGDLLYLIAVAELWFLVGRFVDRFRLRASTNQVVRFRKVSASLTLSWGMVLLLFSVWVIRDSFQAASTGNFAWRPESIVMYSLFVLWSLILVVLPAGTLSRGVLHGSTTKS
jgi:hypothetical protein